MDLSQLVETPNKVEKVTLALDDTPRFDISKEVELAFKEVNEDAEVVLGNLQTLTEYLYFKEGPYPEPDDVKKYTYSINRMLGCDYDLLTYVNYMGRFFITLGPVMYYELLNRLVPKMKPGYYWRRSFINPDVAKEDKEAIERIARFLQISIKEAKHCFKVLTVYMGKESVFPMLGLDAKGLQDKPKKRRKKK